MEAIKKHFDAFVPYASFQYVIFFQADRRFFGMMDARALVALLQDPNSILTYSKFAEALNKGNEADRTLLTKLPSFIPVAESVSKETQKREALQRMERTGKGWLPVVEADGKFVGIVDRSRLIASIVLDVTNRLTESAARN